MPLNLHSFKSRHPGLTSSLPRNLQQWWLPWWELCNISTISHSSTFSDARRGFQLKLFKLVILIERQWQQWQRGWSQEEEKEDEEGRKGGQETIKRGKQCWLKHIVIITQYCTVIHHYITLFYAGLHLRIVLFYKPLWICQLCFQSLLNPSYLREARQVEKEIKKEPVTERRERYQHSFEYNHHWNQQQSF